MKFTKFILVPLAGLAIASCAGPSNSEMQMAQERTACAELGIDPGSNAFGQCVGNLDASMFEAGPGYPR